MSDLMYVLLGGETKYIEFKEKYSKTMLKTVSAFANYHDGKIIIGVTDSGQVLGVDDPLKIRESIENTINYSIKPRPDYEVEIRTVENKMILIFNVFKGDRTPYVVDKKAYRRSDTSSVEVEQYETGMLFYQKHINRGDIIKGPYRESYEEIPEVAYREAIANIIIHRDYSRSGNNRVEFFEYRVEITSIGGLPIGISKDEYIKGSFSNVRNRIIADLFLRCGIIEKMGTGIRRMKNTYSIYDEKPSFDVMENSIRIVLPKIKLNKITNSKNEVDFTMNLEEEKALNYIKSTKGISRNDLEEYMGIKKTKATKLLNALLGYGIVIKIGTGKNTLYKIR